MNDSAIRSMPRDLRLELETLRDQRDLYRSLLLSETAALAQFMSAALETVERIRVALRLPTRDNAAFRGKIDRLQGELAALSEALMALHLPTVRVRLTSAQSALHDIEQRLEISGNDLLPAMVVLEELCSHLLIAADCAAVHVPLADDEEAAYELEASQRRAQPKLAAALRQLVDKAAAEHDKRASLVTMGLEDIPEGSVSTLFDLLGQLLRNAIEHGIEAPAQRMALSKPELGTLVVEYVGRGSVGAELNVQDDGAGLDAERIAEVAVCQGLLSADAARSLDPRRLASLIFHPGLTTAQDPARRGLGMQIVREHVVRLGGKVQVATKRGYFTRYRITLPPPAGAAEAAAQSHKS
jgi:signal transduction histidine kinase